MERAPIDLDALAARVFKPDRSTLGAARAAVEGIVDPREAWSALAEGGLIPPEWIEDPLRRFVVASRSQKKHAGEPKRRERVAGWVVQAYPARVADAITIAASAASVAEAETHAREAARGFGASPEVPVVWRVEARWQPTAIRWRYFREAYGLVPGYHTVADARHNALRFALALRAASGHNGYVVGDVNAYELWRLAAMTLERFPQTHQKPWERFTGQRFAEVPNPVAPVLAVWALGFGVGAIREDAIVLVALRVEDTPTP
jgi:hypothetical protein